MSHLQKERDELTGALVGLARATEGNDHMVSDSTAAAVVDGLYATHPDADFDSAALLALIARADIEKRKLVPECYKCAASCGRNNNYDICNLTRADESIRALKTSLLTAIRDIAACVYHAVSERKDEVIHQFLYRALFAIGMEDWDETELLPILQEAEHIRSSINQSITSV